MTELLEKERVDKVLAKYPLLGTLLLGGVLSKKMTRELLDIDKWLMEDIYKELVMAKAIMGTSSSCFKATKECILYLQERRLKEIADS